jgi:fructuronate reductase
MVITLRLSPQAELSATVGRPRYDRDALQPGIVHLGLGAFMRGHLAVATEAAIHATGDLRWGIVGVSLRQADTRDALAPQRGLYTVAVRERDGTGGPSTRLETGVREALQVIGCVQRVIVAPEDPQAALDAIAAPATRIVSLTITEKGYGLDPATRKPRLDTPDHAHDLRAHDFRTRDPHADDRHAQDRRMPIAPRSAAGFIVHGLERRRAAGLGGVTLMSLDNLASNGHALRALVLDFAHAVDPALVAWIDTTCTFPCSMVDRIVPRTTDADRARIAQALGAHDAWPVVTEAFFDWAVEDHFAADHPAWTHQPGARVVPDAAPWEALKLRMVNGAHTTIACCGVLAGWPTVDVAIAQPEMRAFVDALMREEIEPTLPDPAAMPGLDLAAYRAQLLARFANPALAHRTAQIAMDGSQKLPPRLLGTVRDRLHAGQPIARLALAVATWLHHLRGVDEAGRAYTLDDPLAAQLAEHARRIDAAPDARSRAAIAAQLPAVFGDLAQSFVFVEALAYALESLRTLGVRVALTRGATDSCT